MAMQTSTPIKYKVIFLIAHVLGYGVTIHSHGLLGKRWYMEVWHD